MATKTKVKPKTKTKTKIKVKQSQVTPLQLRKINFKKQQDRLLQQKTTYLAKAILSTQEDLCLEELFGGRGTKHITALRWVLWRALKAGGATYYQIGDAVKKHHTTVLYQVGKHCPEGYEKLFSRILRLAKKWDRENL